MAKAWSCSEDSEAIEMSQLCSSRRRMINKKYESEPEEPKTKYKKMYIQEKEEEEEEEKFVKNVTTYVDQPEPPAILCITTGKSKFKS